MFEPQEEQANARGYGALLLRGALSVARFRFRILMDEHLPLIARNHALRLVKTIEK